MRRKNKGLTLVEVLVVLAIMGILGAMFYTVFKSGSDAWTKSTARLDIYQNARVVLDQISRELAGAFAGGTAEFTGTDANPDTLEFMTQFGGDIYKIKYLLDSGNNILYRSYIKNPADYTDATAYLDVDFGFKISDIQFQYMQAGSFIDAWADVLLPEVVRIEIKLKENPADTTEYTFETYVYLPNSE